MSTRKKAHINQNQMDAARLIRAMVELAIPIPVHSGEEIIAMVHNHIRGWDKQTETFLVSVLNDILRVKGLKVVGMSKGDY